MIESASIIDQTTTYDIRIIQENKEYILRMVSMHCGVNEYELLDEDYNELDDQDLQDRLVEYVEDNWHRICE